MKKIDIELTSEQLQQINKCTRATELCKDDYIKTFVEIAIKHEIEAYKRNGIIK